MALTKVLGNMFQGSLRSVTGTASATGTDDILLLSSASFTLTLPTAVGVTGKQYKIIHNGTSVTQVYTIDGNGSETISGATTYLLNLNQETVSIVSDGANWVITDRYIPTVGMRVVGNPANATADNPFIYATETFDSHGAYDTGTGRFTAPKGGIYQVSGFIYSPTSGTQIRVFVDGSVYGTLGQTDTGAGDAAFSGLVQVTAGQLIDIRPNAGLDADNTIGGWNLVWVG